MLLFESDFLEWWSSSSDCSPDPAPAQTQHIQVGLGVGRLQLDGFRSYLQAGERDYLDSLQLGPPDLLQDYFLITDQGSNHVTRAVCVLYENVLLLCRYHSSSSLRPWGDRAGERTDLEESVKLFVYAYLYPRQIDDVASTRVGAVSFC